MSISRKTWLMLVVAAVVALSLALPAYATIGSAGYMSWSSFGGTNGTSPHGGYSTTTQKCVVCHAVHNASSSGTILLQAPVESACVYCHVTTGSGYTQVYGGVETNYNAADTDNAHNCWTGGPGVSCTGCHQVHAATSAMTNNTILTASLLKGGKTYNGSNYDSDAQAPLSSDGTETALTKWCTSCHDASVSKGYGYYNDGNPYTLRTHIMTTATASYLFGDNVTTGRVAWLNSNYCSSCHASDYGTAAWPHMTTGKRFLVTAANSAAASVGATDTEQDGICLRCHRNNTGSGVGLEF